MRITFFISLMVSACSIYEAPPCSSASSADTSKCQQTQGTRAIASPSTSPKIPKENSGEQVAPTSAKAITSQQPTPPKSQSPSLIPDSHVDTKGGYLRGFLTSAFRISIDGVFYENSEEAYTSQLANLLYEIKVAGLAGYSLRYDAQLGLSDMAHNTRVFLQGDRGAGFSTAADVDQSGAFSISIPDGFGADKFEVKTAKRIAITLASPGGRQELKWCFNLFGFANDATLDKPVTINTYYTQITSYECLAEGSVVAAPNPKPTASTKK